MKWYVQCFGKWQGGLGDFFRSWFCTFVYARRLTLNGNSSNVDDNATVQLFIPDHPLKFCLYTVDRIDENIKTLTITTHHYDEREMRDILDQLWAKKQSAVLISNLRFLECHVLADYRAEFRAEIRQTSDLKSRITKLREDAKLENDFCCIHLRCGDRFMTHSNGNGEVVGHCDTAVMGTNVNEIFPAVEAAIEFLKSHRLDGQEQNSTTPILLITDNSKLKRLLVEKYNDSLVTLNTDIVHLAVPDKMGDDQRAIRESTLDTAAEFFILGQSKANVMLAYSGFVIWPSFIYEVPLYQWRPFPKYTTGEIITGEIITGEIRQFDWIFPY